MKGIQPLVLVVGVLFASAARADQVELSNGDTISGKVVSLNATHLVLKSELLGDVTLAREHVAAVYLGDKRPAPKTAPAAALPAANRAPAAGAAPAADDFINRLLGRKTSDAKMPAAKTAPAGATPQELLQQLQRGELDSGSLAEVQKMFPLLATKEAGGYFNETLSGLITGKLGIGDIRKEAIKARDGIMELKKDIGRDADALNPYLGILEKFIKETEPEGENADADRKREP
jgi:hypothetical protein